jgi:hypothetical protein
MGRFSDFERKVDEVVDRVAELSDLERKVAWTWLLTLAATLAVTWWIDGLPVRRVSCGDYDPLGEVCVLADRGTPGAEWRLINTTPTIEILIAAVGAPVLFIAYLRIWKRPNES